MGTRQQAALAQQQLLPSDKGNPRHTARMQQVGDKVSCLLVFAFFGLGSIYITRPCYSTVLLFFTTQAATGFLGEPQSSCAAPHSPHSASGLFSQLFCWPPSAKKNTHTCKHRRKKR